MPPRSITLSAAGIVAVGFSFAGYLLMGWTVVMVWFFALFVVSTMQISRRTRRRRSLVDLVARAVAADPLDGPMVQLEASVMADDMARYAPTAVEPVYRPV